MAGYSNQKVFILYEDEHLLVVKNAFWHGISAWKNALRWIKKVFFAVICPQKSKTDNPYLAVVHRLDRPVAGVMVYAKTKNGCSRFKCTAADRKFFQKKYEAVVSGIVPACEGRLEDYLTADKRTGTTSVSSKADPLAKKCRFNMERDCKRRSKIR